MSILDDAIREHLELKRAHGADDAELKKLEDEAFGPPQRPDEIDPFAEAPTEFLMSPGETAAAVPEVGDEDERSGRRPNLTDLQEPPPPVPGPDPADAEEMAPPVSVEDELSPPPDAPPPRPGDAAEVRLPPPPGGAPAADLAPPTGEAPAPPAGEGAASFFNQELALPVEGATVPPTEEAAAPEPVEESAAEEPPAPPAEEEHPAGEHEVIADAEPSTAERHAIADQPTQMFDVQAHVDAEAAAEAPLTGEQASPTDEELVDAAQEDPQAAPPAPAEAEPEEGSGEFDFFNEQRLSDELDQALEAPLPPTDEHLAMPRYEDAPAAGAGVFDFGSQAEAAEASEEPPEEDDETGYDPETGHEDVLEDTPRFLEDAPEDDDLWFEQKPPKDFDLD